MDDLTQRIIDLYQSGLSLKQVGVRAGKSTTTIYRELKKAGIPRRGPGNRKYFCDDNYFEIIDTEPKANWLGFLAGDGGLSKRSPQIILNLGREDKDHVIKFKEALGATYPVRDREVINQRGKVTYNSGIRINSQKMHSDLISHGVPPAKSLILEPPIGVPDHLIPHWVRGLFDGDGYVGFVGRERKIGEKKGTRRLGVRIKSTREVLEFIQDRLGGMGHIYPTKSKAFVFVVSRQEDVRKFCDYVYKGATIYLERKRVIFNLGL